MGIAERLKEERGRLGFSQADFAEIAGAHRKSQGNYESGERFPDAAYLAAIAKAGADIQYIVTGVRSDAALTPDERELLALYRTAPLAGKMAAAGALQGAMNANQPKAKQVFHGDVGQVVEGGVKNTQPVTFNVGGGKKKRE